MPKTVEKIRRGFSGFYWKHALVTGERFPDVAFHDPSYAEFVSTLKDRGYEVPDDLMVEDFTIDAPIFGCGTISEVLRAEAERQTNAPAIA